MERVAKRGVSQRPVTLPHIELDANDTIEKLAWQILGGKKFMLREPSTLIDFWVTGNMGIKKDSLAHMAMAMDIPMKDMATLLSLSYKTLARKRKSDLLSSLESSLAIEIARVLAKGVQVFEDMGALMVWMKKPNRSLGGQCPYNLLHTPTGINSVHGVLIRIEEGVYS